MRSSEDIKKDIQGAESVISLYSPGGAGKYFYGYYEYDQLTSFSNEPLKSIYEGENLDGKTVLTVGGSGDHPFSMALCGAKRIDVFDINKLSELFIVLKRAAILGLPFEKFYNAFDFGGHIDPKEMSRLFEKIESHLPEDVREFWYLYYKDESIRKFRYLFVRDKELLRHKVMGRIPYMTRDKYNELKERIPDVEMEFITSDLRDLPSALSGTYDHINLSNILTFSDRRDTNLVKAANELKANLNRNGDIHYAYIGQPTIPEDLITYLEPLEGTYEPGCSLIKTRKTGYKYHNLIYRK